MNLSVILPTYNRSDLLPRALENLINQNTSVAYEILVVDNNSADATQEVIQSFVARDGRCKYIFEKKQGLSHARNAGIVAAGADAVVFTDDDVQVKNDWVERIHQALLLYPEADYLGGKVVPPADGPPLPPWAHTALPPFGLQDLGDKPVKVSQDHPVCLVGACLVCRKRAFEKAGLFDPKTQRVKDGVGSTEDADWERKVWEYGGWGMYVPEIVVYSPLEPERLEKSYHRRWHMGHGKFHAKGRRDEWTGHARTAVGVPLYVYRQAMQAAAKLAISSLRGQKEQAFRHECDLLFAWGFIRERWQNPPKRELSHQ